MKVSSQSKEGKYKSRHIMVLNNLRKKEENWDNRFYLDKIPKFKQTNLPQQHLEVNGQKQIQFAPGGRIRKKANIQQENQQQDSNNYIDNINDQQQQSQQSRQQYSSKDRNVMKRLYENKTEAFMEEQAASLYEEIKQLWENEQIPQNHREIILQIIRTTQKQKTLDLLKSEIDDMKNNKSLIQNCQHAIESREKNIQNIKDLNIKLENLLENQQENQQNVQEIVDQASEQLTCLRLNTVSTIECIGMWRDFLNQYLKQKHHVHIPYLYKEENYILKIKHDTDFLINTMFSQFFNFNSKPDPFLFAITMSSNQIQAQIQHYISKTLLKRIKNCEVVLLEEVVQQSAPFTQQILKQRKMNNIELRTPNMFSQKPPPMPRPSAKNQKKVLGGGFSNNNRRTPNHKQNNSHNQFDSNNTLGTSNGKNSQQNSDKKPKSSENIFQQQKSQKTSSNNGRSKTYRNSLDNSKVNSAKKVQNNKNNVNEKVQQKIDHEKILIDKIISQQKQQDQNCQENEIYIQIYLGNQNNIKNEFNDYIANVPKDQSLSFLSDFDLLMKKFNSQQEPSILIIKKNKAVMGYSFICIDKTCFTNRRMYINHISCLQQEDFEESIKKLNEFIWKNDPCTEIRVNLYHYKQKEEDIKEQMNKNIQFPFKEQGFRWKMLGKDQMKQFMILKTYNRNLQLQIVWQKQNTLLNKYKKRKIQQANSTQIVIQQIAQLKYIKKMKEKIKKIQTKILQQNNIQKLKVCKYKYQDKNSMFLKIFKDKYSKKIPKKHINLK